MIFLPINGCCQGRCRGWPVWCGRYRRRGVKLVKDHQCLLPGLVGGSVIADGVISVAETGEGVGFVVVVAEFVVEGEGLLVVGDGLLVVVEVVIDVAEAVQSVGFTPSVTEFTIQVQGLLAIDGGLRVVPEQSVAPANRIQSAGLPGVVAGGAVKV